MWDTAGLPVSSLVVRQPLVPDSGSSLGEPQPAGMLPFKLKSSMPEKTLLQHPHPEPTLSSAPRLVRTFRGHPVDRTPVWFLRQAGRYMPEYQAVRRHHSLLEICQTPQLAAEVTITAAEKLDVDAAIIFADLLLPFTPMGLDFEFINGEGPTVHHPVRTIADIDALRTDRGAELSYVSEAIQQVAAHLNDRLAIIGFCGAPYTLASYMIEGRGSRNWIETKSLMYRDPEAFRALL